MTRHTLSENRLARTLLVLCACGLSLLPTSARTPKSPDAAAPAATVPLARLAQRVRPGFRLGSFASGLEHVKPGQTQISDFVAHNFNIITVGVYMGSTQPAPGEFDFRKTDAFVGFATDNRIEVYFHPLIGGAEYTPAWINNGNFGQRKLQEILRERITQILTRYRGRLHYVDVVNESLVGKGLTADGQFDWQFKSFKGKEHVWMRMGMYQGKKYRFPQYLVDAFRISREVGGADVKLILNEWSNATTKSPRGPAFLTLIEAMREEGVPVDGAGLQLHCRIKDGRFFEWGYVPFDFDAFDAMLELYRKAGIDVHITEFDIHLPQNPTADDFRLQGEYYGKILAHVLKAPAVRTFKTWGFTDKYSWKEDGVDGHPLMLDENLAPKPAYTRMVEVLWQLEKDRP